MPTRWPVLINSGLQRTLLRQTRASCSFLSISGASAPGHHPVRRFFHTAVFSPPRWSARRSSGQMAGDAQPPRMGNTVPVNKQQVRFLRKLLPRRQQRRRFAKREKAGNIGHGGGDARHLILHQLQFRRVSSTIAARVTSPSCSNPTSAPPINTGGSRSSRSARSTDAANCCCWIRSAAKSIWLISYW